METDCKSVRIAYDGSNPSLPTKFLEFTLEILFLDLQETVQIAKLERRAGVAQSVERQLPKLNVESSNLFSRSKKNVIDANVT